MTYSQAVGLVLGQHFCRKAWPALGGGSWCSFRAVVPEPFLEQAGQTSGRQALRRASLEPGPQEARTGQGRERPRPSARHPRSLPSPLPSPSAQGFWKAQPCLQPLGARGRWRAQVPCPACLRS